MKKLLLLSILSTLTFSCSEYSDNGTPNTGDNANTPNIPDFPELPDSNLKKLKSQNVIMEIAAEVNIMQQSLSFTTNVTSLSNFTESGNASIESRMSTQMPTEGFEIPGLENLTTSSTSSIEQYNYTQGIPFQFNTTNNTSLGGQTITSESITRYNFDDDQRITSISILNEGVESSNVQYTHNGNEVSYTVNSSENPNAITNGSVTFSDTGNLLEGSFSSQTGPSVYRYVLNWSNNIVNSIDVFKNGSQIATTNINYDSNINPFYIGYIDNVNIKKISPLIGISNLEANDIPDSDDLNSRNITYIVANSIKAFSETNVTSITMGDANIERNSYTYDDDNYPTNVETEASVTGIELPTIPGMSDPIVSNSTTTTYTYYE